MKISLEWLNSYLLKPTNALEAENILTNLGFPMESKQDLAHGDLMLDIEVTSNRSDCLYHLGMAREVAAGLGCSLRKPDCSLPVEQGQDSVEKLTSVQVEDAKLCPLYTARVIRGVKIKPSPDWLVRRLASIGLRSVNNVVDVTNYVMMELGQPLHAFDLNKLAQHRLVVRVAKEGETLTAIDGGRLQLKPGMLVIADGVKPAAVAGIMGGLDSEVSPATTDILLESALFDPLSVRQTSRALKLSSDASYRFERRVEPGSVDAASRRAARMIVELAGGSVAPGVIRVGSPEPGPKRIQLRPKRCRAILGVRLRAKEMLVLLDRLGLTPILDKTKKTILCTIPTYRLDLDREIDLIEEVARLAGLDCIKTRRKISLITRPVQPTIAALRKLRQVLIAHGYLETINFSFVTLAQGQAFLPDNARPLLIDDDRRKREPMLRPSLLPSLLNCRKANQDVGNHEVNLFETAASWVRREDRVVETRKLAMLTDLTDPAQATATLRQMRGCLNELIQELTGQLPTWIPQNAPALQQGAAVKLGDQILGFVGLLQADQQKQFDLATPVALAELDLEPILAGYPPVRTLQPLPRFPAIERDLSIVIPLTTSWSQVEQEVRQAKPALLEEVRFVTTYRGKPIPAGAKSLTLRLVFRDPQATLRHEQVDPQVAAVVDRLKHALNAQLRA